MPNVEIHGETDDLSYGQLYHRVVEALRGAYYEEQVVVTGCHDEALNLKFEKQPYLRVWATNTDGGVMEDVEKRLAPLGLYMEFALLAHCVPARSPEERINRVVDELNRANREFYPRRNV